MRPRPLRLAGHPKTPMKRIHLSLAGLLLLLTAAWLAADSFTPSPFSYFSFRAVFIQYSGVLGIGVMSAAMMLALRVDPLSVASLDDLRDQVITDMKTSELKTALSDYGASLENHLDTSAINKLPMTKIVNK